MVFSIRKADRKVLKSKLEFGAEGWKWNESKYVPRWLLMDLVKNSYKVFSKAERVQ